MKKKRVRSEAEKAANLVRQASYPYPQRRAYHLKSKFGMTWEEFENLTIAQDNLCAICQGPPTGHGAKNGFLAVDHDHATGKVRGLLCHHCNLGIGQFGDDPELMERAAAYLKKDRG